ncbi:MAG: branched-chain amino acid ABC transporter permease [Phreatobacter sp.]|uniref:branched-chain amino acid ABC transporter permease n=1 Tax=Phreatobacter sp. TaxID=1966341 RepID=UPI001A4B078B|nr:branched-chain amino acid ABC transporter permease [Phreatobacter sp.]MBL8567589.1 branched-chain amino acid ABC transporter permease [Phreatobacter sp.]
MTGHSPDIAALSATGLLARLASGKLAVLLVLALLVAVPPLFFPSGFYYRVGAIVWILAIATIGLNLLMGFAGQVSLGHAGFLGIGAYAVALLPSRYGVHGIVAMVIGAALSALIAWVAGRPILRLRGHYLAVATLGFGILISMVLTNEQWLTGGPDGMRVPRLVLFDWPVRGSDTWYWIGGGAMLIAAWLALNLVDSPTGRALRAIHDSEVAARVVGVDVARYKLAAFVISAVYASIAGSLLAFFDGHITPDTAGFLRSVELVTMVVIGGMGSVVGSVIGTLVIVVLPQTLTFLSDYKHIMVGAFIMLFMIFLRAGIVPSLVALVRRRG